MIEVTTYLYFIIILHCITNIALWIVIINEKLKDGK
jgi:hypothetical protein